MTPTNFILALGIAALFVFVWAIDARTKSLAWSLSRAKERIAQIEDFADKAAANDAFVARHKGCEDRSEKA